MAGMGQFQEHLAQAFRLPGVTRPHGGERFNKNPAWAGGMVAEEPAGIHYQRHRPAAPGYIPGLTAVAAMHAPTPHATDWTGHGVSQGFQMSHQAIPLWSD
jgi:hypothetical protein